MIIHRLAENIRKQNWFTVFIEFVIVVVGIFVGLQVDDWNEDRAGLNQTKNYLAKKLIDLDEDLEQLNALTEHRTKLYLKCKNVLDKGYDNASDYEIVDLVLLVTVERRFVSSVADDERDNISTYFKNISSTGIESLEQDYRNMVNFITFTESRLNTFSESLEEVLWSSGYVTDNRKLFGFENKYTPEDFETGVAPKLKRDDKYPISSLMGIVRRNEISSSRLNINYAELMKINNELQVAIKAFLNS
ncbi:MAG: hypothetical protein KJO69_05020 [Gammaproteobacteria bacterium]|nr:hypothetical protein [Gammaproteobacteria bacterium]NNJ71987.1 hypothetical protein [Enterobacterales bacterium]